MTRVRAEAEKNISNAAAEANLKEVRTWLS